ncbi:putative bifunctional diguanylate cyclase/phosphodiesterase [Reinekea sp.]|jgi:diguanylate cyclase (GGDEF)-like protein|uniref:putative bifunctional diguanylate cyclase/phosphodiesterase n=1 Tax=Reinekea sp. TaxID=1970455 RepID=UPI00398A1F36
MPIVLYALAGACLLAIFYTSQMLLHASLAIFGISIIYLAFKKSKKLVALGFALMMALIIVPLSKWYLPALLRESTHVIEDKIEAEFDVVISTLNQFFLNNSAALESLSLLIASEENFSEELYQAWMQQLLPEYRNNYLNIAISENLMAKHVYPINEANLSVLNRNLGETPGMGFIYKNVLASQQEGIIGPIELIQGVPGIIKVIPVPNSNGFIISGVLSLQSLKEQLLSLVPDSSMLSLSITGFSEPFFLIGQRPTEQSLHKTYRAQSISADIYLQSGLLDTIESRATLKSHGASFLAWLLLTIALSWQHYSIRQRDNQRLAILENERALIEAQRLGQLGSWRQAEPNVYMLSEPLQSLIDLHKEKISFADLSRLLHPKEKEQVLSVLEDLFSGRLTTISTQHRLKVAKKYRWFEHKIARTAQGELSGIVRDIHTIKSQERQVAKLEAFDPLTGASNRSHFQQLTTQNIATCERRNTALGLMIINVDDFRSINEKYNQSFGDELLKQMAIRLISTIRKTDFVARLGGDTFAIALIDVGTTSQSVLAVENILSKLKQPYNLSAEVYPQFTVGVALYPDDALDFETLLQRAEQTLLVAKSKKRGHYSYYSAELDSQTNRRQQILTNLPSALKNDHLYLVFQPRVSSTGEHSSLSMEALVRWQDPELGFVSPGEFIPIAEGTSLITDIGSWVMDAAFATMCEFKDQLPRGLSISINLSPKQLEDENLVANIKQLLKRYKVDARRIEFEVTEHSLAVESITVLNNMRELNEIGFKFALDDFGTGYSNLSMLQSLPLHVLKIDMSFIRNIGFSDKSNELVRAIIDLGHTLGLHTVAEGVETMEQVLFLEKLGCEELQGYYFYKPAPIQELLNRLS